MSADPTVYITEPEAARRIGLTPECLRQWRKRGVSDRPPHYQFGPRVIRYAVADLDAWIASCRKVG